MSEPQSPRKRSLMPSNALRARLRAAGHALSAVVQIGKEGTTPAVLNQLRRALTDHELVKVKIGQECPETRFEAADHLAAEPDVQLAQILGRTILVYKHDPVRSRYEGQPAPAAPQLGSGGATRNHKRRRVRQP